MVKLVSALGQLILHTVGVATAWLKMSACAFDLNVVENVRFA